MATMTLKQLRALWGLAARSNITADDLRRWSFQRTGKNSLRALTRPEASRLIGEMVQKWEETTPPRPRNRMTPGQGRILTVLEKEIGWNDRRLLALAKKMYHVQRIQGLQLQEASGLIEALKAIRRRRATPAGPSSAIRIRAPYPKNRRSS